MTTKIYIVSLARARDRRDFMVAQLARLGMPYEFVDAVDAMQLTDEQLANINAQRKYHKDLKRGEVACVMSHAKACARFLEEGSHEHALIIEDDVILGRRLSRIVAALEPRASGDRATLLYSPIYQRVVLEPQASLLDEFRHVAPDSTRNVFGTQAYFVSRAAASALSRGMIPVRSIADDWHRYVADGILAGVDLVYPFPVLHAEFLSVINPASGTIGLRTRVKNFLYYNRVFPFYQLFLMNRRRTAEVRQRSNIVAAGCPDGKTYRL